MLKKIPLPTNTIKKKCVDFLENNNLLDGLRILNSIGEDIDFINKLTELQKSNVIAQFLLGKCFEHGLAGQKKDITKALQLFEDAAKKNLSQAHYTLGHIYSAGNYGLDQNYEQAYSHINNAATQGLDIAQYHLGWMYLYGKGVTKDSNQAMQWYLKSANQGCIPAQFTTAWMYQYNNFKHLPDNIRLQNSLFMYKKILKTTIPPKDLLLHHYPQACKSALNWYQNTSIKEVVKILNALSSFYTYNPQKTGDKKNTPETLYNIADNIENKQKKKLIST